MPIRVLVTGANGQLGSELQLLAKDYRDLHFEFYGSALLDLSSPQSIRRAFQKNDVDYVINCGAYTQVDKAEDEVEKAYLINTEALKHLSGACNDSNATLIHISSDYVYDSLSEKPISESDPTEPKGEYAKSKLGGDLMIQENCKNWIIIRTSWVYSSFGNNFVKTMLRLGAERDVLSIVNDQIGTPTYAQDIAKTILLIVNNLENKDKQSTLLNEIYNFSNAGITSWDAFAKKIFDLSDIDCDVIGISTEQYGAKAPRPLWSVLSKRKIESALNLEIRDWESALEDCLESIQSKP